MPNTPAFTLSAGQARGAKIGRRSALVLVGTALLALGTGRGTAAPTGRVAFLMPGSINDQSWNAQAFGAAERLKTLGWEVAYTENVQAADMVEALRDYARRRFDVVVGHTGRFLSAAQRVGPQFPNTIFIVGSGSAGSGKNVTSIEFDNAQFGYLMGALAARTSRTGKLGSVNSLEGLPTVVAQVGGFRKGARAVRPDIEVRVIYIKSMEDAAEAKEAALSLIAGGADVIAGKLNAGQVGIIQAARERDVFAHGRSIGHSAIAPDNVLTNIVEKWGEMYTAVAQSSRTDGIGGKFLMYGLNSQGSTGAELRYSADRKFSPIVTADVVAEIESIERRFANEELTISVAREDARGGS